MRTNFAPTIEPIEINWQINPIAVVSKGKNPIFLKKGKRYLLTWKYSKGKIISYLKSIRGVINPKAPQIREIMTNAM